MEFSKVNFSDEKEVKFVREVSTGLLRNESRQYSPIIINKWLADDIEVRIGWKITLSYYIPGRMRQLVEKKSTFRVKDIVSIKGWSADKNLMPDFPGLTDTENCSEWDSGIPVDLKKVREKDEKYWDDYRGISKAFIGLREGQTIWSNQFGSLTAVRFQKVNPERKLQEKLQPGQFGLSFIDIAGKARFAAKKSVDFGGLFLGLSFFIIFSAFILTAMLFALSIKSRAEEIYVLSNLGFKNCEIRRIIIIEHAIPATIGAVAGIPFGMLYNIIVIRLLNTLWKGAVGTSALHAHISTFSAVIGSLSGLFIALITMWIILRNQVKKLRNSQLCHTAKKDKKLELLAGSILFIIGIIIVLSYLISGSSIKPSAPFFAAGGILLLSFWCFAKGLLDKYHNEDTSSSMANGNASFKGIIQLSIKNSTCNIMRSMSGIMLLSCGIFLTLAVAINIRSAKDLSKNSSGTGGYNLFVKTSLPIIHDLNTEKGRKAYDLDHVLFQDVDFTQMRLVDGNEASCLNLNRVEKPAILGADFAKFAERKAFTFSALEEGINNGNPWKNLNLPTIQSHGQSTVSVVADNDVIMWIMGKKVEDILEIDDENGQIHDFILRGGLANSIFQGYAVIPIWQFMNMYPSSAGSNVILVDCPDIQEKQISDELKKRLSGLGIEVERCRKRLRRFQNVENTYLSIFLILGGLGLIIGAAGFGIVVIRNIIERREELAILHAIGFNRNLIRKIILLEHLILIFFGIFAGSLAAAISAIPAIISSRAPVPLNLAFAIIAGIVLCGIVCVYSATFYAVKAKPIKALRKE